MMKLLEDADWDPILGDRRTSATVCRADNGSGSRNGHSFNPAATRGARGNGSERSLRYDQLQGWIRVSEMLTLGHTRDNSIFARNSLFFPCFCVA